MKRTKKFLKFLNDKGETISEEVAEDDDEKDNEDEKLAVDFAKNKKKNKIGINLNEAANPLFENLDLMCYGCETGWGAADDDSSLWKSVDEIISTNIFGRGVTPTIQAIAKRVADEREEFPGGDFSELKFGEEEIERHLDFHVVNQKFKLRRQLDDNAEMIQRLKNMENLGPVNINFFIKLTENERKILDAIEIHKHNKEYTAIVTKKS